MVPRYDFTTVSRGGELFFFGGFDKDNGVVSMPARFKMSERENFNKHCEKCVLEDEHQRSVTGMREVTVSTGFLHSMALGITFPFKAVELII